MRRLRFLLRPGWLALIIVVLAFAYLAFTVLAPWQLGKNTDNSRRNDRLEHALATAPVPISELVATDGTFGPDDEWRTVELRGRYLPSEETLLRLRPGGGKPAIHALTPFRDADGRVFLVNRGYLELSGEGGTPEIPAAPTDEVAIVGHLLGPESTAEGKEPRPGGSGRVEARTIDPATIGPAVGVALEKPYIQLEKDQPGTLTAVPLPEISSGPYLSYGLQWIAFGIMVPLGLGYFVFAEIRERRREAAGAVTGDADTGTPVDDVPGADAADPAERAAGDAPSDGLAARYDRHRPGPARGIPGTDRPTRSGTRRRRAGFDRSQLYDD